MQLKEIMQYRKDIQNSIIALENGELMSAIAFCRNSEFFGDDDVEYFKTAIIKDVDGKDKGSDIAITYLNDCLEYLNNELMEVGLMPTDLMA